MQKRRNEVVFGLDFGLGVADAVGAEGVPEVGKDIHRSGWMERWWICGMDGVGYRYI